MEKPKITTEELPEVAKEAVVEKKHRPPTIRERVKKALPSVNMGALSLFGNNMAAAGERSSSSKAKEGALAKELSAEDIEAKLAEIEAEKDVLEKQKDKKKMEAKEAEIAKRNDHLSDIAEDFGVKGLKIEVVAPGPGDEKEGLLGENLRVSIGGKTLSEFQLRKSGEKFSDKQIVEEGSKVLTTFKIKFEYKESKRDEGQANPVENTMVKRTENGVEFQISTQAQDLLKSWGGKFYREGGVMKIGIVPGYAIEVNDDTAKMSVLVIEQGGVKAIKIEYQDKDGTTGTVYTDGKAVIINGVAEKL